MSCGTALPCRAAKDGFLPSGVVKVLQRPTKITYLYDVFGIRETIQSKRSVYSASRLSACSGPAFGPLKRWLNPQTPQTQTTGQASVNGHPSRAMQIQTEEVLLRM